MFADDSWYWEHLDTSWAWNSHQGPQLQWLGTTDRYALNTSAFLTATQEPDQHKQLWHASLSVYASELSRLNRNCLSLSAQTG